MQGEIAEMEETQSLKMKTTTDHEELEVGDTNGSYQNIDDNGTQSTTEEVIESKADVARKTLIGMVIVAIGTGLFCSVGAVVQVHGGSVLELMLGRYIIQNLISWIIWFFRKPAQCVKWYGDPPFRMNIWVRGILYFLTTFCWWRGLEMVPIGDGEAILFISPIVTVIAARILLKEALPKTFILTLILSVTGLVFICQPSFIFSDSDAYEPMSWKGLLCLLGAVFAWSGACILVRTAKEAHWLQLETVSTTQAILVWCPLVILINQVFLKSDALSGGDWEYDYMTFVVMVIVGSLGFSALMLNVIGYQIGDATKVAWMEYLDLVFAFMYQWLYFQEEASMWEIVGCCCLLGTCFIHLTEEYLHYRSAKKEEDAEKQKDGVNMAALKDKEELDNDDVASTSSMDGELAPLLGADGQKSKNLEMF